MTIAESWTIPTATIPRSDHLRAISGQHGLATKISVKTLHKVTWRVMSGIYTIYSWDVPSDCGQMLMQFSSV